MTPFREGIARAPAPPASRTGLAAGPGSITRLALPRAHRALVNLRRAAGHDGGMAQDGGPDWAGYYTWSAGRQPRSLLVAACQELGTGQARLAVDLGCGDGTEALELLARGWSVLAVDAQEAGLAVLRARITATGADRIRVLCSSFTEADLPHAHLIHAGFSLPFCRRRNSRPSGRGSARHSPPAESSPASCSVSRTAGPVTPA